MIVLLVSGSHFCVCSGVFLKMKSEMIFFFEIKRKKVNFKSKFTQALQTLDYSSAAVFLCVRTVL